MTDIDPMHDEESDADALETQSEVGGDTNAPMADEPDTDDDDMEDDDADETPAEV